MRVGIVGAEAIERADVPIRPESFVRQQRAADSRPYKRPVEQV